MACRHLRRAKKYLGTRGAFLLIVGVGEMAWGAGMIYDPPSTVGLSLLTDRCPLSAWAWLWIIGGLAAATAAFVKVGRDGAGFITALVPPSAWALSYAAAAITGNYSRGGFVAIWYLTSVGIIMWASTVPEYSVPPAPRPPKKGVGS